MSVSGRRSFVAALLLLLVMHAVQASAVHTHLAGNLAAPRASAETTFSSGDDVRDARRADNEAQCLLCRLQRNLSSTLYSSAPTFSVPSASPLVAEIDANDPTHESFRSSPKGRAPPLN